MLESKRQSRIIKKLEEEGWYVVKLMKTNKNGIPDLLAVKEKDAMFIEVKQPDGVLSEIQKYRIDELKSRGVTCHVWIDYNTDYDSTLHS